MKTKSLLTLAALLAMTALAKATSTRVPPAVLRSLDAPSEIIVYTTNPNPVAFRWWGSRWFHGYRILGTVRVTDPLRQRQVTGVLRRCATTDGDSTKCIFSPRHAVRLVSGPRVYDFVLCFECSQMEVYAGETLLAQRNFRASPEPLNRILQAARIKLARDAH